MTTTQPFEQAPIQAVTTYPDVIIGYDKPRFLERFTDVTKDYDDELSTAWETATLLRAPDTDDEPEIVLNRRQVHQIDILAERIHNARLDSVVIEAAHVYAHESLDDPALRRSIELQCAYGTTLTRRLKADGVGVHQILFYDDYNPDPADGEHHERMDVDELLDIANKAGYNPGVLLREAAMAPLAHRIIGHMDAVQGLIKTDQRTDRLLLTRRNVELYRGADGMVSCAMLDASLTLVKLANLAEGVVNILPRRAAEQGMSYKGQQEKMRTIVAEHLSARVLPVFNLFTGDTEIAAGAHHTLRKPR